MRFLLDTNVITEVAKPRPNARVMNWLLAHEMASVIPSVAMAERYQGAHNAPKEQRVRLLAEVDHFIREFGETVVQFDAEAAILKVNNLSAEEIASQASSLYDHWQTMEPEAKREIVEVITDKVIVGKDEITINLTYSPSCKDMANRWRKGWDSDDFWKFFQFPLLRDHHLTTRGEQPHN